MRRALRLVKAPGRPPGRPAFASKDRLTGTADENKAAVQGMIAHYGSYTVDEAGKTFTFRVEASSFPNWDATSQKRAVTAITDEMLTFNNPTPSTSGYAPIGEQISTRNPLLSRTYPTV